MPCVTLLVYCCRLQLPPGFCDEFLGNGDVKEVQTKEQKKRKKKIEKTPRRTTEWNKCKKTIEDLDTKKIKNPRTNTKPLVASYCAYVLTSIVDPHAETKFDKYSKCLRAIDFEHLNFFSKNNRQHVLLFDGGGGLGAGGCHRWAQAMSSFPMG